MKETPRKDDDDSSKGGRSGKFLQRTPKVEEALKAWQRIPSALESVAREVNQETKQIPKEMSKALYRAKTAVSSAANKGKTIIKNASSPGVTGSSDRSSASSQQDNDDSSLVVQPKEHTDRLSIPSTVPNPHPSPHHEETMVDFQNSAFFLTSSMLVVAVGATFAQYDSLTNVPWNLVLPWLLAAMTMGYASGYHHRSRLQELELENQRLKSQQVDQVIRQAHFRVTMTGKYHPPVPRKPSHKLSVIRRMFKPILGSLKWFRPSDRIEHLAEAPVSELTMEKEKYDLKSPFLRIPLPLENVTTLDEYTTTLSSMVQNLGMDIFFNGGEPKSNVSTHPALMANLRREAPLLIINGMTHIANVLLYFQLPDWFTSWTDIQDRTIPNNDDVSKNDKPEDLERMILMDFLLGDDIYRHERLFVVPHIVDAPLAVKAIAPSKAEILVNSSSVPSCWHKSKGDDKENRTMFPALELELDLIASRAIRSIVGLVARHLHRISIDVACIIYDKDLQKSACLTCFCISHVDMTSCPSFPEAVEDNDVLTTSLASNESPGQ